jgi:hypothetical protein
MPLPPSSLRSPRYAQSCSRSEPRAWGVLAQGEQSPARHPTARASRSSFAGRKTTSMAGCPETPLALGRVLACCPDRVRPSRRMMAGWRVRTEFAGGNRARVPHVKEQGSTRHLRYGRGCSQHAPPAHRSQVDGVDGRVPRDSTGPLSAEQSTHTLVLSRDRAGCPTLSQCLLRGSWA